MSNQQPPNNQRPGQPGPQPPNQNWQQQQPPRYPQQPYPQQQPQQPPPMETTAKTYNTPKDYQRDLPKMAKAGWTVVQTSEYQPGRSLAGKVFVPFGLFTKPPAKIVVTYQRQRRK